MGARNDAIIWPVFSIHKFYNMFKWSIIPEYVELIISPNPIKQKFERVDLRNSISKYNIIYDALQVISYKNLKRSRNIGFFGDLSRRYRAFPVYNIINILQNMFSSYLSFLTEIFQSF